MSSPDSSQDSVAANVAQWTQTNAEFTDSAAQRQWGEQEITWGVFGIPESQIGCLGEVDGLDVVELGCGTAYFSARLARLGARPVGVDPTPAQLATARRMQQETGLEFPLVEAPGEDVPLPDASFDLAFSEYGASLWADPAKWLPEAARLLRPGGRLVFLTNSVLVTLCVPDEPGVAGERLLRDQFGMYRVIWPGDPGIEYHIAHSDWIRLLRENGFEIEALHELRPGDDAKSPGYYDYVTVEWARRWPAEEIWVARKTRPQLRLAGVRASSRSGYPPMSSPDLSRNVAVWTKSNAEYTDASAARAWAAAEITWGMFAVPETEVGVLGDMAGLDVVELGCGTAYVSAWLAKRGARVVGVDPTPAQLATARRLMVETGIEFPLVEAAGEAVPLPDASFDLALSEHGAATWADPHRWIPEAARLLRPGGRLVFLHETPLACLCYPPAGSITTELQRPYFGLRRLEWEDGEGVDFQLSHGDWIEVLHGAGFDVERLVELQAPPDAVTHEYYADVPAEWARRWPAEEIWVARKT